MVRKSCLCNLREKRLLAGSQRHPNFNKKLVVICNSEGMKVLAQFTSVCDDFYTL